MSWIRNLLLLLMLVALINSIFWINKISDQINAMERDIFHMKRIIQNMSLTMAEQKDL